MRNKKVKKDKKDKIPMGKALRYNLLMLGKIWKMSPLFVLITLMTGIVDGISGSVTTVFTYMLFNELDKADVTFGRIALYLLLILGVNAALTLFNAWYHQFYWVKADKKLQFAMHSELFDHAMKMDLACYDDPKFYNDYVWAMDESKGRAINVMNDASGMLGYVIQISTLITLMMQVNWVVGLILFVGCILNACMWNLNNKMWFKLSERTKPHYRKNSYINRVYHLADYAKELRIGHAGEKLQTEYVESMDYITGENVAMGRKMYWIDTLTNTISTATRYAPIIILLFKLFDGSAELGAFVASINIIWSLQWSMYDLAKRVIRMPDNAQYIAKYLKFLEYKPKIVGGDVAAEPLESIELRNVTFTYQPILEETEDKKENGEEEKKEEPKRSLEGVNLTIRKGEKVAIVGYNGAGKT
ncbi:MAG: ABC transporter ATP-binding protein, partial [Clostridia bacterium]|nr:ABC transporter ATP-binding protein [Clostridia bacterium]